MTQSHDAFRGRHVSRALPNSQPRMRQIRILDREKEKKMNQKGKEGSDIPHPKTTTPKLRGLLATVNAETTCMSGPKHAIPRCPSRE